MSTYELFSELTDKNTVGYLTETEWKEMVTESLDEKIIEKIYIKSLNKIYDNIKSHWLNNTSYAFEETIPITELRSQPNNTFYGDEQSQSQLYPLDPAKKIKTKTEKTDPYKAIIQIEKDEMASRYNEYIQFANKGIPKHKSELIERLKQRLETLEANHNTQQVKNDLLKNIVDTKIKIDYFEQKEIDLLKYFLNEIKDTSKTDTSKADTSKADTKEIIFTVSSSPLTEQELHPHFMTYFVLFLLALLVGWLVPIKLITNAIVVFLCFNAMDLCTTNKCFAHMV
jgi:hypothetical protein